MADKVKLWFNPEGDFLEVTFSSAPGYMRETKSDAVMQRGGRAPPRYWLQRAWRKQIPEGSPSESGTCCRSVNQSHFTPSNSPRPFGFIAGRFATCIHY